MRPFPSDTMAAKIAFYGDPRGAHGVDEAWFDKNMSRIAPPFQMLYAGKPIKSITFHRKCVAELSLILEEIWEVCGKDQQKIHKLGLDEFGGSFNYRLIRGSSNLSNHSFGIAIDIAPTGNELGKTKGTMPQFVVKIFKHYGFKWGGDYKGRKDWMHFEAVSG